MFQVLRSSAGAGKTHALVKHYLTLALRERDPAAYARILALTFTNKAAAEMRERILAYLKGLANGGELSATLSDVRDTVVAAGVPPTEVQVRASAMLRHILHHWPRFAVSTIDAFTRRVVMPFARDLRLDSELRMTTEEDHYRSQAVEKLLEDAGTDADLTALLIAICEDLLVDERDHRPDKPLNALTQHLTQERALTHLKLLRTMSNAHFLGLRDDLRARTNAYGQRYRALGRKALEAIASSGLPESAFAYGKNGAPSFLKKLAAFNDWIDMNANVAKALESGNWSSKQSTARERASIEDMVPMITESARAVIDAQADGSMRAHAIACAVLRDLLPTAALHLLDDRLEEIKRADGATFFSDLLKRVADVVDDEPAPFLYERLGERYDHFLIDEFQDTSLLQWRALLPLITNALSGTGTALLVGDAKQAIYRWRNGEARQFTMLPAVFGAEGMTAGGEYAAILERSDTAVTPLVKNYRSAEGLVRMNNALFDFMRDHLPEEYRKTYTAQAQEAHKRMEGHMRLRCYPPKAERVPDDGQADETPLAPAFAVEAVNEAVIDGFLPGDIAVIVRTKAQGRAVAEALTRAGHQVVSPDGLSLGSDSAVQAVAHIISWLHRPDDRTAAQAAQAMAKLHAEDERVDPFTTSGPQASMKAWSDKHTRLSTALPVLEQVHVVMRALGLDPATDAFTLGLLNEVHRFAQEQGDDLNGFLEHWERVQRKRSVGGAHNDATIRVMTVHASKGLQFPVVIVPWADMRTRAQGDPIWIDPAGVVDDLPAALVRPSKTLKALDIPELEEEAQLNEVDLMDLLYVAFTRPEERLYAGVDGQAKEGIAAWLRTHFNLQPGTDHALGPREGPAACNSDQGSTSITLAPSMPPERTALTVRQEAPEEWDPADPDPYRSHGNLVHAVLARTTTAGQLEEAVRAEAANAGLSEVEREGMNARLMALLQQPGMETFFDPTATVRCEAAIMDRHGNLLRPDRIVYHPNATQVLDIKTGTPKDAHTAQVRRYAEVLRDLGEPGVTAHLLYINANDTRLVDVDV